MTGTIPKTLSPSHFTSTQAIKLAQPRVHRPSLSYRDVGGLGIEILAKVHNLQTGLAQRGAHRGCGLGLARIDNQTNGSRRCLDRLGHPARDCRSRGSVGPEARWPGTRSPARKRSAGQESRTADRENVS